MSETKEKSWQARIGEATDAIAQKFVESISYDRRIYKQDIAGSIAHATMLAKVKLITDAERDAIIEGLKAIERDIESGTFIFDESLEDIHMVVEDALIKRIGEPGKKLHTGRSRNDQVATDLLLWCRVSSNELMGLLNDLLKCFVHASERNAGTIMPCFTHLQRAQPIDAGAELLAWATMFLNDLNRIESLLGNDSGNYRTYPLGSGAIAGSTLPIDRRVTETILGEGKVPTDQELSENYAEWYRRTFDKDKFMLESFEELSKSPESMDSHDRWSIRDSSSIEATASRDAACDLVYACAMISQHLSRWAEQWIIYMTTEFGFIKIADRYTTSSSMMPQKRNPDMLELIRGRCGNVYGDLFALMTILKGLPIGYNRDLQEDKRIVFRAYDTVSSCLTMAAAIVNSASYDKERIEPTLDRGFLDATSLAEYLVTQGIPFRTAHHIVGTLVARCEKEGKHALSQLSLETFNETLKAHGAAVGPTAEGLTDDLYTCLGAKNVVKRYQSAGAAGGKPFEDQLAAWKKRLNL
jgi:argininosuccinate lyase